MRVSTIVLPIYPRRTAEGIWRRAEQLGFHSAYTYDHLTWRGFRDGPWFGMVPTLAMAAHATRTIRLGTMVTSPNFRHPVPLAKDLITLDDLSDGRITVGIGSGGTGFDAFALGDAPWTARERADRFGEFVPLLSELLENDVVTADGTFYRAADAYNIPGCVQAPRIPLYIAANGPRGMRIAARLGQGWVTTNLDASGQPPTSAAEGRRLIVERLEKLAAACHAEDRAVDQLDRVLVHHPTAGEPLDSVAEFVSWACELKELGFTELALHWPVPDSVFAGDPDVFEAIATEGAAELTR